MKKWRSFILWLIAVVLTLSFAVYQKMTGPTYPIRENVTMNGAEYALKFKRTAVTHTDESEPYGLNDRYFEFSFPVDDEEITGTITYRRYKSYDEWTSTDLIRRGDELIARFPEQPWAGKTEYTITFNDATEVLYTTPENIILRFKGDVPAAILIPHILLMFLAMLLSTRAGIAALLNEPRLFRYTVLTLLFLVPGGMILGPIVQKFAFGAYWTGWPLGTDLTDNKTAIAFLAWIIAFFVLLRNRKRRWWAFAAALILTAVYLVPHSVLGSEIDYRDDKAPADSVEVTE